MGSSRGAASPLLEEEEVEDKVSQPFVVDECRLPGAAGASIKAPGLHEDGGAKKELAIAKCRANQLPLPHFTGTGLRRNRARAVRANDRPYYYGNSITINLLPLKMAAGTVQPRRVVTECGLEVPRGVVYRGWEPGGEYTKTLVVKNVQLHTQRIRYK